MYDIYDMWHQPWWQRTEFRYACIIFGIAILLLMGYMVIRWYRKRLSERIKSPWERALEDLEKLKPIALRSNNDVDMINGIPVHQFSVLFYGQLSAILKRYLHDRFAYAIVNSTDWEIIAYLKALEVPEKNEQEVMAQVVDVLQGGYYVKFAGQRVVTEQIERHFNMSIAVIKKTIPRVPKE